MTAISWLLDFAAWLQADGRLDFVTLGLALATLIYVGAAVAGSIRSDIQAWRERVKADLRIASVKRTAAKSRKGTGT